MIAAFSVILLALAPQEQVVVHEDVQYSDVAKQPRRNRLDLFVPATEAPPPVVMFVHGGAWTGGSKDLFGAIGETLAGAGFACAVINTQLFPFARPDAMVVDCADALGFLHRSGSKFGVDGEQLFVMGHSSGAHLCSWLAYDDRQLKRAGVPKEALRGAVLLSGVYDVRAHHPALDGVFGADRPARRRATTWLYAGEGDCPTYLGWAQRELPGLDLCAEVLRDRLLLRGVPVRSERYLGRNHRDYIFQFGTARDVVTESVVEFLREPGRRPRRAASEGGAVLWVAADAREQRLGEKVAKAVADAGVEVVVRAVEQPDGAAVTRLYRELRAARTAAGLRPLRFTAGFGAGGLAVATSTLTAKTDGLAGRVVAAAPLAAPSLRAAGLALRAFPALPGAPLLCLVGDRDAEALRQDARQVAGRLRRRSDRVFQVELVGTTAEAAIAEIDASDDLLRPMLLTFLGAAPAR